MNSRDRSRFHITAAATLIGCAVAVAIAFGAWAAGAAQLTGPLVVGVPIGAVVGLLTGLLIWGEREDGEAQARVDSRLRRRR